MTTDVFQEIRRFVVSNLTFQRKNGYIFSAWGKLRLVEHHVLLELDRPWLLRPSDLALRLNQPAAQLAHVLSSLKRRGIVREVEGDSDREKFVLLTKKGQQLSRGLDDISNQLMNLLAANIGYQDQKRFYEFWELLNNGLGAPHTVARPGDHPLRLQTRRFTRIFGYFARRPESSSLSFSELHLLYYLTEAAQGAELGELAQELRAPVATIKKIATKLSEAGFCTRPSSKAQARIEVTEQGRLHFEATIDGLSKVLMSRLSAPVAARLAALAGVFESTIQRWTPRYEVDAAFPSIPRERSFFLELQVQILSEFARASFGILQEPLAAEEITESALIVLFQGPTPCLSVRLRQLPPEPNGNAALRLSEFGFSNRVNWKDARALLEDILLHPQKYQAGDGAKQPDEIAYFASGKALPPQQQDSVITLEFGVAALPLRSMLTFESARIQVRE
ncbi:MAG: hypothetical protein J0M12_17395 [Deltaproteobacteria bacterium]|nr:hypothetical protein [Deltaproteobacteria bacterium]